MESPFFIVGPTSVGKTEAAIALAEACGGEIVNADAFQVYAGLDLLTAKPSAYDRARVAHHLVGSVPLGEPYNVARYLADATRCLDSIHARGRRAIVAGGSGMYVKALTHGLAPLPPAQPELRASLDAMAAPALLDRLRALDPASAESIDPHNKRRLVRAVEVCLATGEPFSRRRTGWGPAHVGALPSGVFLLRDRAELHRRIELRVEAMFAEGVVEEVRGTPEDAIGPTAARVIGLAEIRDHLRGRLTLAECQERIRAGTRQYARRQITWFKRETIFEPVNLSTPEGCARMKTIARG